MKQNKTVFDITIDEYNRLSGKIPYGGVGHFKSITGKHTIEILSKNKSGTAGLVNTFPVKIDGNKEDLPFYLIRKIYFELPDDYNFFVTWDHIQAYKKGER